MRRDRIRRKEKRKSTNVAITRDVRRRKNTGDCLIHVQYVRVPVYTLTQRVSATKKNLKILSPQLYLSTLVS